MRIYLLHFNNTEFINLESTLLEYGVEIHHIHLKAELQSLYMICSNSYIFTILLDLEVNIAI